MSPPPSPYQKKIPLWVQMLTGGLAGSIGEVSSFLFPS